MTFQVEYSNQSQEDLNAIAEWYTETSGSAAVALTWLTGLLDRIDDVSVAPTSYPLSRESERFPFELRELHYGNGRRKTHRALFRLEGDLVIVLRVRHVAQKDLSSHDIPDDWPENSAGPDTVD